MLQESFEIRQQENDKPLISVVIPVYNAEKYLVACLDSVCRQTYKNLQIIIVNDGSTDRSGIMCDEYALRDNRFEVYHQKNAGQATARNEALKKARGEWIAFLDNDDIIEAEMYEKLLNNAMENHVLISGCATLTIQENGNSYSTFSDMKSGVYDAEYFNLAILYQTKHAWGAVWNKIWHVSMKNYLYFPDGMQLEDYWVSLKAYNAVGKVYFDNRAMYHWYHRTHSQSHKKFSEQKLSIMTVSKKISDFFENYGSAKEKKGGYYFDFSMRLSVIDGMIKIGDKDIQKNAKKYLRATWKSFKKIKITTDVPLKAYTKKTIKLFYITFLLCFR